MTPEQINIAIAESQGWQRIMDIWYRPDVNSRHITRTSSNGGYTIYPPDFTADLNAMHEVELGLTTQKFETFWVKLASMYPEEARYAVSATALQRAEAYLRTIGKWKD